MHTIARLSPFSLLRRWLAVREAEAAARKAEADREILVAEIYARGRADERRLLAGTP